MSASARPSSSWLPGHIGGSAVRCSRGERPGETSQSSAQCPNARGRTDGTAGARQATITMTPNRSKIFEFCTAFGRIYRIRPKGRVAAVSTPVTRIVHRLLHRRNQGSRRRNKGRVAGCRRGEGRASLGVATRCRTAVTATAALTERSTRRRPRVRRRS